MSIPRPLNLQGGDSVQNRINTDQTRAINALIDSPLAEAIILTNVSLTSGSNKIPHGLGRKPIGWFVSNPRAAATFFSEQPSNPTPDKSLWINASANLVTDIVVF